MTIGGATSTTPTGGSPDGGASTGALPDGGGSGSEGGAQEGGGTGTQAESASVFLESLGVNIHDDQDNSDDYAAEFTYTGIRNARAGEGRSAQQIPLHTASASSTYPGVMFDVLFYGGNSISAAVTDAVKLNQAGALLSIEGPNEPNNQPFSYNGAMGGGQSGTWVPVADFQRDVYSAVKSNSTLAGTPVYTISEPGAEVDNVGLQFLVIPAGAKASLPDGTKYADFANCHNYVQPGDNNAWDNASSNTPGPADGMYGEYVGQTWNKHFAAAASAAPPHVTTETGWTTSSADSSSATDQTGQALDILNIYLSQFARGFAKTFIYQMFDDDGGNAGFGIYASDKKTPKTAATYIHNLTTILADLEPGTPGKAPYTIASPPSTVHDLLLQKSDATFYLIVWNERISGSDAVTVDLGATRDSVVIYDPTTGTAATKTLTHVSTVPLTMDNRPFILAFK